MKNGFAAFGFFALVTLVLAVSVTPALAITWGQLDELPYKYPNVGAIMVHVFGRPADVFSQVCSGTLISPTAFLTAGHCTNALTSWLASGLIDAVYVSFDRDLPGKLLPVDVGAGITTHPDYKFPPNSDPYDVGLLILKKPVRHIVPAKLPELGFLDRLMVEGKLGKGSNGAKFTVVGYGGTLSWPPPSITYADQRQWAVSEYRALLPAWLRMSQNHATGDGGTCYGDSGGPTFWDGDNGRILVATTSWGDAQCVSSEFNYRVDIPQTLKFISDNVHDLP